MHFNEHTFHSHNLQLIEQIALPEFNIQVLKFYSSNWYNPYIMPQKRQHKTSTRSPNTSTVCHQCRGNVQNTDAQYSVRADRFHNNR